ncbi:MAG: type III pantothenate kinase, partial [Candidatus Methylomirabilis sp.]
MLLALDVGNTNTVVGVFEGKELRVHWRLATRRDGTGDEYGILIKNLLDLAGLELARISAVAIASVVPPL